MGHKKEIVIKKSLILIVITYKHHDFKIWYTSKSLSAPPFSQKTEIYGLKYVFVLYIPCFNNIFLSPSFIINHLTFLNETIEILN